jgi:hypothetical protein
MSATVIPFPVVPRPMPAIADPRYRAGAAALATAVLRERGYPEDVARRKAVEEVERACRRALADAGYLPTSSYIEWHHSGGTLPDGEAS